MAEDVNANIRIGVDTSDAITSVKNLQRQIALLNAQIATGSKTSATKAAQLNQQLVDGINATGRFAASMTNIKSSTEAFTTALEKNKLSMGQYFRYSMGATRTFGRFFGKEFDTIQKVAIERTKDLQTQFISLGRDANGALRAIKVRPLSLDMTDLSTRTMIAAQKMQLMGQLMKQGSTQLLNWGKNTQWAGRQLMVGFTIPLTMFGAAATKSFMEIEKQILKIQRVYGDFNTTVEETKAMTDQIRSLAQEYTKYGVAVTDTLNLAADAAAAGKTGQELLSQISEATRLAVLGNVEQTQALETTMSITNAFGTAAEDLAGKIDFLNAVENQSVTSIEDLTEAIPKAGPVVQQLGGDVEDLAFFLTAMKEGGINASEGANALKSGLASLINPTGKAKEMLAGFGINIEKIVESNKGDIKGLVIDFASALDTLDPLNRARAIEQLFGKFQFSRLSTLFQNVIKDGSQAQRVLELTNATTQELAILSKRELAKIEQTTTYKFEKALADFQAAIAPVGEEFLKLITPVIEFGTKLLQQFNNMDAGVKQFVVGLTALLGVVFPALLMTVGLFANGIANILKLISAVSMVFKRTSGDAGILGNQFEYMTQAEIQAAAAAASLDQVHSKLRQTFTAEKAAVDALTTAYQRNIAAQKGALTGGASTRRAKPAKYAKGVVSVPGPKGAGDVVPAMLAPGEAVIPAKMAKKYGGLINGMISNNIPGYELGLGVNKSTTQSGLQRGHIGESLTGTAAGQAAIAASPFGKLSSIFAPFISVVGNLVADMSTSMNQMLKNKGMASGDFLAEWNSRTGRLAGSGVLAGLDVEEKETKKALDDLQRKIGERAVQLGNGTVTDRELEKATKQVLAEEKKRGGVIGSTAGSLQKLANTPGAVRLNIPSNKMDEMIAAGQVKKVGNKYVDVTTGQEVGRVGSRGKKPASQYDIGRNYKRGAPTLSRLAEPIPITRGQKAAATRRANEEARAQAAADAQAKRDAYNARRRERYAETQAAKRAAAQPAPKKPGIGSRIASGVRGVGGMGLGMGISMAGGAMAMVPGLEGLGTTISMIGPLFMMLPPQIAAVAAALAGLVGIIMSIGSAQEKQRKQAIELGNAQVMSIAAMNKMAEDMGTVSATQAREAEMSAKLTNVKEEELTAGQQYIKETESGKKLLSDVKAQQASGDSVKQIAESVASNLANAVAQNVITQEQGRQIIAALGIESGNLGISSAATKQFSGYTADLTKTSGLTSAAALETVTNDFAAASKTFSAQSAGGSVLDELARRLINPSQFILGDTRATGTMDFANRNAARSASTATINAYGQSVGGVDAINAQYDTLIAQAKTQEEINDLENRRTEDIAKQNKISNQLYEQIRLQKVALGTTDFNANFLENIKTTFGETSPAYTTAQAINALGDSTFKTRIQTQLESGTLSPESINVLMDYASKNKGFGTAYDLAIKTAGEVETLNLISSLQAAGAKVETQTLMLNIVNAGDYTAEQLSQAAQAIQWLNENGEVNIDINANNGEVLKTFANDVIAIEDELKNNGGKFTTELIAKYTGSKEAANALKDNKNFNKLPKQNKVQYLAQYHAVFSSAIAGNDPGYAGWARLRRKYGMDDSAAAYAAAVMDKAATSSVTSGGGNDGKDKDTTTGGGGGGGTKEDKKLAKYNKEKDKAQKALNVIALKEDAINKKYEERKKALEDISRINSQISEQQKAQLDVASALASGDIAAAARAVQAERARAAQFAQDEQMRALEAKRQAELNGIVVNGKTKEAYEAEIARLNLLIAERELALALKTTSTSSGGSGGGGGGGGGGNGGGSGNTGGGNPSAPGGAGAGASWKTNKNQYPSNKDHNAGYGMYWQWKNGEWTKTIRSKPTDLKRGEELFWRDQDDTWGRRTPDQPTRLAFGGMVAKRYMASGGSIGSDTVSAMLTPGEFVVKRPAVQGFGVKNLEAINNGQSLSGSVYNYNVNVNVATGSDPDKIARSVVTKIRSIDKQRLGGNSY